MTDQPTVLIDVVGRIGQITLNRPASINALDHPMALSMHDALRTWANDPAIDAVVVAGAGERGLCAGGDIAAIHRDASKLSSGGGGDDAATANSPSGRFWADEYRLNLDISTYPKPYVAIMDGIVMGGGVGISAHGNTRVVTDRTRLAMPEVGIGFVPDVGGTFLLARVPDQLGTYAALTGGTLSGADAIAMGLADHYVPAENLDAFRDSIVSDGVDAALSRYAVTPPASTLDAERDWIREAFAADTVSEIIEGCRAVGVESADRAADRIASKSPASLAATLYALRHKESDLAQTLRREYRVSLRFLQHPDMAEGIRAQVIDKDRTPAWTSDHASAAASLDAVFAPLPAACELSLETTTRLGGIECPSTRRSSPRVPMESV
ncbi:enoyl-CoA hydratase/isomerase family protein [Gordonia sp. w5E2]|uniref:enoyl-CoA hydratase/isomerase family protein n=1 Tax=Gordonia TaxID=2053 RepID=UPI0009FA6633|nr:enoyl-CoA hydratase/isomerase family protein [Gordonia jacobaea]